MSVFILSDSYFSYPHLAIVRLDSRRALKAKNEFRHELSRDEVFYNDNHPPETVSARLRLYAQNKPRPDPMFKNWPKLPVETFASPQGVNVFHGKHKACERS